MALNTTGQYSMTGTSPTTYQAYRERAIAAALSGVTGVIKVILEGGGTITGTVDTTLLGNPSIRDSNGGTVKITDATPTTWLVPASCIVAIGQ